MAVPCRNQSAAPVIVHQAQGIAGSLRWNREARRCRAGKLHILKNRHALAKFRVNAPRQGPKLLSAASRRIDRPNPVAEFTSGLGESLYHVGASAITGGYFILTTNPILVAHRSLTARYPVEAWIGGFSTIEFSGISTVNASFCTQRSSVRTFGRGCVTSMPGARTMRDARMSCARV